MDVDTAINILCHIYRHWSLLNSAPNWAAYIYWQFSFKGLFTRTVSVSLSVTVSVKVYHYVNGNRPFDRQNERQMDHHYVFDVNLTEMVTETDTEMVSEVVV